MDPLLKKEFRRVCFVPNLNRMDVAVKIMIPTKANLPMENRLILSKLPWLFMVWMMYSKTTIDETVIISSKESNIVMPIDTAYWRKNPWVTVMCREFSKPPKIALTPLAIKNIDSRKP